MGAAVVIAVVCSCCALYFMSQDKGATRDLPTRPVQAPNVVLTSGGEKITLQQLINQWYNTESDCWHVNRFMRVSLPTIYVKYSDQVQKYLDVFSSVQAAAVMPSGRALLKMGPRFTAMVREMQAATRDLLNCPEGAEMKVPIGGDLSVTRNARTWALEFETASNNLLARIENARG